MADIISPWTVSRYRNAGQARTHAKNRAKEDRAWCEVHGKDCRPLREHPKTEAK
jgi:hypothetical protein